MAAAGRVPELSWGRVLVFVSLLVSQRAIRSSLDALVIARRAAPPSVRVIFAQYARGSRDLAAGISRRGLSDPWRRRDRRADLPLPARFQPDPSPADEVGHLQPD